MSVLRKLSDYDKNYNNPFIEEAIEKVNGHMVKKYKSATMTGQSAVLQAYDEKTGEVLGHTQFIRQIEVDEDKFTKIYLSQFSAFWELSSSAIKVFGYVMTKLIPKQDLFSFFIEECKSHTGYSTKKPIYQGLAELLNSNIIARGPSDAHYFINPMVAFNGDRVTFAKSYIKKKKEVKEADPNQLDIFDSQKRLNEFDDQNTTD